MLVSELGTTETPIEALESALDGLVALDPDGLDDTELADAVVELHRQEARLAAAKARLTAALDARRVWAGDGSRSAGAWVAHRCRLPLAQTRAAARLARRLRHMPATAEALTVGEISERHVSVLAGVAVGRTAQAFAEAEEQLVEWARTFDWVEFSAAVEAWRHAADPDGVERDAADDEAARRVHLSPGLRGTGILDGLLTPVGRETLATALQRIEQELWEADWEAVRAEYGEAATPAHVRRTPAQRRHDALVELARRAMAAPPDARLPVPLVSVLVGYETFKGRVCKLANGVVVTPGTVASMLDDALIERVVFDGPARVVDLGRARSFTGAARRALEVRDQRCTHPTACDAPLERCQGDHITPWSEGGETTPDNGQLRCGFHNRWRWAHSDPHPSPPVADAAGRPPPDPDVQRRVAYLEAWRRRLRATITAEGVT